MADGFEEEEEPYHVPQQSRREKLRVVLHNQPAPGCAVNPHDCAGLLPLPSDLLTCAALQHQHHLCDQHQQLCMDPPSSLQDFSGNPFFFAPQNLKLLDQSYTTNNNGTAGHEIMVYKPEPLALSLSSHNPVQHFAAGSSSAGLSRSSVPLGPFTGYASILKGSRFLRPAQQLLEELCDVACRGIYAEKISAAVEVEDSVLMDCPPAVDLGGSEVDDVCGVGDGGERRRKKSRLISMLDEVYKRYKYYYQQMQAVVASFESVAGLSNAAPFANLALKAMSKHFRSLKNAIIDQLHFANKAQNCHKDESTIFGNSDGIIHFTQRSAQNTGLHDHQPVWRPQRGLPERAVTVLRAWLFDHFLHPYPTDTDKMMLAKQTGLSRNQVSNWFINARVRLWKPMVEEIHNLETRQVQKTPPRNEQNADKPSDSLPTTTSTRSQNPYTLASKTLDFPSKRAKNELPVMANGTEEPMRPYYENLSRNQFLGVGSSTPRGGGSVSLTLGLHQNNGIGIHEPFPINAARRFGLDANTQGYVLNNFESQNREFGRDVIGGQLLHDFVG